MSRRAAFGTARPLGSGRWHASYSHPAVPNPAVKSGRWNAPDTFETEVAAERFLRRIKDDIDDGIWTPPAVAPKAVSASEGTSANAWSGHGMPTLRAYAETWLKNRRPKGKPLQPNTIKQYRLLLNQEILPTFGELSLDKITKAGVRIWHQREGASTNMRSQSYGLLGAILKTAVDEDDLIEFNPCTIRGAGTPPKAKVKDPLSAEQMLALCQGVTDDRYAALVGILSFCGLRFEEMALLAPADINLVAREVRVRKSKTDAGVRTVPIPNRIVPLLRAHLETYANDRLVFPAKMHGKQLHHASIQCVIHAAAKAAGITQHVHPHLLRHSGATLFSQQPGVTVADVQRWLGHSTPTMAMRYMHSNDKRLNELARDM